MHHHHTRVAEHALEQPPALAGNLPVPPPTSHPGCCGNHPRTSPHNQHAVCLPPSSPSLLSSQPLVDAPFLTSPTRILSHPKPHQSLSLEPDLSSTPSESFEGTTANIGPALRLFTATSCIHSIHLVVLVCRTISSLLHLSLCKLIHLPAPGPQLTRRRSSLRAAHSTTTQP